MIRIFGKKAPVAPDGGIDLADGGRIEGWAFDPAARQAQGHVVIDNRLRLSFQTGLPRPDVLAARKADHPDTGFLIDSAQLRGEESERLDALFDDGEHLVELFVRDSRLFEGRLKFSKPVVVEPEHHDGSIDVFDGSHLAGWLRDGSAAETAFVTFCDDLKIALRDHLVPRPDVAEAVGPDATGFSIDFSLLPAAKAEALRALWREAAVLTAQLHVAGAEADSADQRPADYHIVTEDSPPGVLAGVVYGPSPSRRLSIEIYDGTHLMARQRLVRDDAKQAARYDADWASRFEMSLPCGTGDAEAQLTARVGGDFFGVAQPVSADLPARIDQRGRIGAYLAGRQARGDRGISIIVTVFNGAEFVRACLSSVLRHTPSDASVIVIDDASTEEAVFEVLESFSRHERLRVIRHEKNRGYTASVNHGIALAGQDDVVLLNSDTVVTPRWLGNLTFAAYSRGDIATATPVSDNAGVFSLADFPAADEERDALGRDGWGRLVLHSSAMLLPETPTGNGFCMYVRRDAIEDVGLLDEEAFPRGYGEENDFCMRARRKGWSHVIDDRTLVFHHREASFGAEKPTLLEAGLSVLRRRFPDYDNCVSHLLESRPFQIAQARFAVARDRALAGGPAPAARVLYVTAMSRGGTALTNFDLMGAIGPGLEPLVLQCDTVRMALYRYADGQEELLEEHYLAEPIHAEMHRSAEYDQAVAAWLVLYGIELVHIRHIAWHSLGLTRTCRQLDIPAVFSFHDFYSVCPTTKLLDERNVYCGGVCTPAGKADCSADLWSDPLSLPPLKHAWVHGWRDKFARMLNHCNAFVTTSRTSADVIEANFPSLAGKLKVIPHGRDFDQMRHPFTEERAAGRKLKVLLAGALTAAKGAELVSAVLDLDTEDLVEFHLMGTTALPPQKGLIHHGAYKREDFIDLVSQISPDIGAVLSIWPETYCHTLTEMWAAGLPVVGIDMGAVGERLKQGGGWLLPAPDGDPLDALPGQLLALLRHLRESPEEIRRGAGQVAARQSELRDRDIASMAADYRAVYQDFIALSPEAGG